MLSIGFKKSNFDFSNLTDLLSIGGVWSKKWSGLEECGKLLKFAVSAQIGNISNIPNISRLRQISLIQPNFKSLEGLELASTLESLRVIRASKLVNIASAAAVSASLKRLEFDKCPNISEYESISNLVNLRTLIIADCKKIDSIQFASKLQQLEILSLFGTIVQDGDLTPCLGLPRLCDFRSEDARSYIPSVKEIKEQLKRCN